MSRSTEYYVPNVNLNRASPIPLYHQIAAPIEEAILSGRLTPGTRVEDELSMARRLNVSRPTARRALQILGEHGLVMRRRGVGTEVAPALSHRPAALTSLFDEMTQRGLEPTTEVIGYAASQAIPELARRLGVAIGTEVTEIRRLRFAEGKPVVIMKNIVRSVYAPSVPQLQSGSLYAALAARGQVPTTAKLQLGARKAAPVEARLLSEAPNAALLVMERVAYNESGAVVEIGSHLFRSALLPLDLTVFSR